MSRSDKNLPLRLHDHGDPDGAVRHCSDCTSRRAPRWAKHADWTGTDRTQVRVLGQRAVAEYAANGCVETELPAFYHHHTTDALW